MTVVGHVAQGELFRDAVRSGRLHHAWLLAGPKGIGKARFARAAATWLLARSAYGDVAEDDFAVSGDHPTARLIAAGSHIDFRTVELLTNPNTGKLRPGISVDQFVQTDTTIGEPLSGVFRTRPALSDWRVIVVDAADDLNRNAANAFLKNLEEPPSNTLFLAVSHSPSRLLPTIRSRCRILRFRPLADDDVAVVLADRLPDLDPAARAALGAIAGGSPGYAVQLAASDVAGLRAALDRLAVATRNEVPALALALARSVVGKAATSRYVALLDLVPAYVATAARDASGPRLARLISLWEAASALGASAQAASLDPHAVAFRLGELTAAISHAQSAYEPA